MTKKFEFTTLIVCVFALLASTGCNSMKNDGLRFSQLDQNVVYRAQSPSNIVASKAGVNEAIPRSLLSGPSTFKTLPQPHAKRSRVTTAAYQEALALELVDVQEDSLALPLPEEPTVDEQLQDLEVEQEPIPEQTSDLQPETALSTTDPVNNEATDAANAVPETSGEPINSATRTIQSRFPIDFPTVLRLAGADNWNVKIARQRVAEACQEHRAARVSWLPSLNFGLGYNKHSGTIQEPNGTIIQSGRQSFFAGTGLGLGGSPLNGGAAGPPRMFVDLSIADAIFKPLAARRELNAEQARENRVFNDTILEASIAYFELLRAQAKVEIAELNVADANQVLELTKAFVEGGKGTPADMSRMKVIVNRRQQDMERTKAELGIASSRLATVLQLDPTKLDPKIGLYAMEVEPFPLQLVDPNLDLATLITHAQNLRCEISEAKSQTRSAQARANAEQWRPWLPNLFVGYSNGGFGGGDSSISDLENRGDLDVVVNWQVKNFGIGTSAARAAARSRVQQADYQTRLLRDQISDQVNSTHQKVSQYRNSLDFSRENIDEANSALEKNLEAIRGLNGLPLESVASLDALAQSRNEYLDTVINYNQWQLRLLRATGKPLSDTHPDTIRSCQTASQNHCQSDNGCGIGGRLRNMQPVGQLRNRVQNMMPNRTVNQCQDCNGCGGCGKGNFQPARQLRSRTQSRRCGCESTRQGSRLIEPFCQHCSGRFLNRQPVRQLTTRLRDHQPVQQIASRLRNRVGYFQSSDPTCGSCCDGRCQGTGLRIRNWATQGLSNFHQRFQSLATTILGDSLSHIEPQNCGCGNGNYDTWQIAPASQPTLSGCSDCNSNLSCSNGNSFGYNSILSR